MVLALRQAQGLGHFGARRMTVSETTQ